jgi:GT2 family glycosyltransferase
VRTPIFSIIIPTYQRPDRLAYCLKSLAAQTFSKSSYEVIVVDDAATEAVTGQLVRDTLDGEFRVLSQNHLGAAAARNAGAAVAQGRYLAFTDDDCQPISDWLRILERHLRQSEAPTLVGGRVLNELRDNVFASASQSLMDFLFDEFNREHQRASLLTSNNFCIPADAFRAIGGFDTAFPGAGGEDRELCLRWAHAGHRLVYAPEAIVFHAHDMNFTKFVRQHLAYGRGAALLRRRALERGYGPIPLERSSFYWDLLRYPQRAAGIRNRGAESVLFAVSQVANTVGYFQARIRERGR